MNPPEVKTVLGALRTPLTADTAAQRLGCAPALLRGLFRQLEARGLVVPAAPGVGACSSGCGKCSMQNFCPSSETSGEPLDVKTQSKETWRLTELGEGVLEAS